MSGTKKHPAAAWLPVKDQALRPAPMKINGRLSAAPAPLLLKDTLLCATSKTNEKQTLIHGPQAAGGTSVIMVTVSTAVSIKPHLRIILCFSS